MANKIRTSFSLSENALQLLKAYAEAKGISKASSLEMFIREKASPQAIQNENRQMVSHFRTV